VPENVEIERQPNELIVKGPKGELRQAVDPSFEFEQENGSIQVKRPTNSKPHKSLHGLYRSLINNMVTGVSQGYERHFELIGVGYRVDVKGQMLVFQVGYSHPVYFILPPEVTAEAKFEKGKNPQLTIRCIRKDLIGQVAAEIRGIRPPEPYKGKGIRYLGEAVRAKVGKAAGKKK
jgi:large subunit ribosomal protein L6